MRFGAYEILAPISTGAMGAVHRARHIDDGREVALKRLLDERGARRFEIEARLLALLEHPRVVRVLEHFEDDGEHFLVMELHEGPSLEEVVVERGTPGLPIADAVEYARQACEALAYVHSQQIVHRDVKPGNMLLGDDGVVLVDFGIAREYSGAEEDGTAAIGTPGYMAPEVFGGVVSPRCDVFGVAATLWTLLSGDPPSYGQALDLDAPQHIVAALRAGLELEPNRRTSSAQAFAAALGKPLGLPEGASFTRSVYVPGSPRTLMEALVRAAADVFLAAASSIALVDPLTGELVYEAAWGAGAAEVVGVRLPAGFGLAGAVAASGVAEAVPDCRADPRFAAAVAAGTGYVPSTLMTVPLLRRDKTVGVLQVLDRRDGGGYGPADVERTAGFAELALMAVDLHRAGRETEAPP